NKEYATKIAFVQNSVGAVPSPFEAWLLLRSVKTLSLRMERHSSNAIQIANFLTSCKYVKKVYYPTLSSPGQKEILKKQMRLPGGIVSFELDADGKTTRKFCSKTKLFTLAESLGGVESLIDHVVSMTHAYLGSARQKEMGLGDNLIRLSVGIENVDDLINDLEQAFKKTFK
ncbi:MAG: PLP-dependent transferase, partial [Planctomycetota bacterium]